MGRPFYGLEFRFCAPLEYPYWEVQWEPLAYARANAPRAARRGIIKAVQAAPHAPVHRCLRYSLGSRRLDGVLSLLLVWWRAHGWDTKARTCRRVDGPTASAPPTRPRTGARAQRAAALDP
jgi:hypothetical protein